MTWGWTGVRGTWATDDAAESMRLMADHGVNWTALAYSALQDTAQSTHVRFGDAPTLTDNEGVTFKIVASPMSFDDEPTVPQGAAPELGQDTELILMDAGMDWDEITAVRETGALG